MLKPVRTTKTFPAFIGSMMVAYHQALEALKEGGLKGILRPHFFWKRRATPVEMDLSSISSTATILKDSRYQFIELTTESLADGKFLFSVPSRGVKASRNLKRGWRGFAPIQGNLVIGDVWCVAPSKDGAPVIHPDLAMLGITCRNRESYAFDMYISPAHRGANLAAPSQRSLQATLKAEGCSKVYGYYWDDHLPARWMHRILKFKELPKRQVSRLLFYQKAETIINTGRPAKRSAHGHRRELQAGDSRDQLQKQK